MLHFLRLDLSYFLGHSFARNVLRAIPSEETVKRKVPLKSLSLWPLIGWLESFSAFAWFLCHPLSVLSSGCVALPTRLETFSVSEARFPEQRVRVKIGVIHDGHGLRANATIPFTSILHID